MTPPSLSQGQLHGQIHHESTKRAVQATKRQCETSETIRSEKELQEVVAITGVANHRERSVKDKALNGGASEWQTPKACSVAAWWHDRTGKPTARSGSRPPHGDMLQWYTVARCIANCHVEQRSWNPLE